MLENQAPMAPAATNVKKKTGTVPNFESEKEDRLQQLVEVAYSTSRESALSSYRPPIDISDKQKNKKKYSQFSEDQIAIYRHKMVGHLATSRGGTKRNKKHNCVYPSSA